MLDIWSAPENSLGGLRGFLAVNAGIDLGDGIMRGGWGPLELMLQHQGDSRSDCDMPFASVESFTPCLGKDPPDSVQLENSVHVSDLDLYQDTNLRLGSSSDVLGIIVWYMRP